jgi:uncharacterized LabA/DUF88 family protein
MTGQSHLRACVLLDWQNIYACARDAFGLGERPSRYGNVDPSKLARLLTKRVDGELCGVRIYRGRPSNSKDPKAYAAWRSQTAEWEAALGELLTQRYRDLRYRPGGPIEKGVDVWLAVDLVRLAIEAAYDRIVVMSSDTDLVPAIEAAAEIGGGGVYVRGRLEGRPSIRRRAPGSGNDAMRATPSRL